MVAKYVTGKPLTQDNYYEEEKYFYETVIQYIEWIYIMILLFKFLR